MGFYAIRNYILHAVQFGYDFDVCACVHNARDKTCQSVGSTPVVRGFLRGHSFALPFVALGLAHAKTNHTQSTRLHARHSTLRFFVHFTTPRKPPARCFKLIYTLPKLTHI